MTPAPYNPSEEELIEALQSKNSSAMEVLYDRYASILFGVILRIVKSKPIAEDVLQETLMKIWRNVHTYTSSKGRFVSWMLRIARNKAIDTTRSSGYQKAKNNLDIDEQPSLPKKEQINTDAIGLKEMVNKLPAEYREVIELAYFGGFTQAEMAEKLDLPLGTIKSRVRIALRELRKLTKD